MKKLRGQFDLELCDGTQLGVIINMYSLGQFLADTDYELKDLEDVLQGKNALRFVPLLMWHGTQCFYSLKDAEPPLKKGAFLVLFGSSDWEIMTKQLWTALELESGESAKKKTSKAKTK
jgi:hypothetical protein